MTNALLYGGAVRSFEPADIDLRDTSKQPLVIWWLPYNEHGSVCGTVVTIDNPNELPTPTGSDPDATQNPDSGGLPTCSPVDFSGYQVLTNRGHTHPLEIGPMCRVAADPEYWEAESGDTREGPDSFIWEFDDLKKLDWNDMVLMFDPQPDCSMRITFIAGDYVRWGVYLDLMGPDGAVIDDFWEPGDVYTVPEPSIPLQPGLDLGDQHIHAPCCGERINCHPDAPVGA